MRVAWFSPMPPVRSGIADCSADLVAALACEHEIDVYVDDPVARAAAGAASSDGSRSTPVLRAAHEFVWRHAQHPYELTVYQLGNSSYHDYVWPYLFRWPGLTVLHDVHLHHARAAALLRQGRAADYRSEFQADAPAVNPDAAELAVAGFDSQLHYEWPFCSLVITGSRLAAVHSRLTRDTLREWLPGAAIEHVRLAQGTALDASSAAVRGEAARRRWGIPADALLFGCFGGLTPDKRISQILDAFKGVLPSAPSARLLLAGPEVEHYDVREDVRQKGLHDRVRLTGYVETDEALTDCIAASDITLNLRWPTAREISGPWLRCLAAGKPSVVVDLTHTSDVPSLDPRTWSPSAPGDAAPLTVAIDILDEAHSLRLAMRRLASDAALRNALGGRAREYWLREHSHQAMLEDYQRVMEQAARATAPAASLPAHLTADGSGLMQRLLRQLDVPVPWSKI